MKFSQRFTPLVSLLTLLSTFTLGGEPDSPGILTGCVLDSAHSQPIPMVDVRILDAAFGDVTDQQGRFELRNLAAGEYSLEVSHIGYESRIIPVTVPQTQALRIRLEESFFQMDEVVVTSTRTEKLHRDVPVATEVISRKDIQDSGALDVGQLLAQRSGITVSNTVTGESVINVLGMDSRYVLVLVDGQPITGKFNNQVSLDQFPTGSLRRVEIIKGPNSALYGSEAMGGVINIITEKNKVRKDISIRTRYSGGDGSFDPGNTRIGKRSVRANVRHSWDAVSLQADFDYHDINPDADNLYIDIDNIDKITARGRLRWKGLSTHELTLDITGFSAVETSQSQTVEANTHVYRLRPLFIHNWTLNNGWSLEQSFRQTTYNRTYDQSRPWGKPIASDTTGETETEYELTVVRKRGSSTFNIGTEWIDAAYRSNRILLGDQSLQSRSVFAQVDIWPQSWLNTVIGSRVDFNTEVGAVVSPRLAAMINMGERWKLRGTVGKGFRMPSFMDRYIDWTHEAFGYRIQGNPELSPETSRGYSLGVEYYHPLVYQVSLMLYRTRFNNMIDDYLVEPGLFSYHNIDRVLNTAVEIQGRWTISSRWLASWGVNIVDNRDLTTGDMIPNTEPLSANVRISYQWQANRFKASLRSKWTGPYTPYEYRPEDGEFHRSDSRRRPFAITDVTLTYRLFSQLNLNGGISNCTDYTDAVYGPFVGRRYFIELNLNLQGD